jgi:hypothetical protein
MSRYVFLSLLTGIAFSSCSTKNKPNEETINNVAVEYVKLCLEIDKYDNGFVDAYYGPQSWKSPGVVKDVFPYQELKWKANDLIHRMDLIDPNTCKRELKLRRNFLFKQLHAVSTRLDILSGKQLPFDFEAQNLYDVIPPITSFDYYDDLIIKLDSLVPGSGNLSERYVTYSSQFIIPSEKLNKIFTTAISEAKNRISKKINLPKGEKFELSYVTNQPWSGYNWYQGEYYSLIQINTDLPIYIDRAVDLACHEGYPGHHVYNVMLEKELVNGRGWDEMMVYPLFSPQSLIAEGSANYGIEMAFPGNERIEYEKSVLFPLAGIDPELVHNYYDIQEVRKELNFAEISIARNFLQRSMSADEAIQMIKKYLLYSNERAQQRLNFYTTYGSYIINYSLGEKMIKEFVEEIGNTPDKKWEAFYQILSSPRTASVL